MGGSARKKKEKKKDFQKTKLKVGKAKPKPSNLTDTRFKARSIVLTPQSLSTNAPSAASQFSHHLSLLKHRSETHRRESLAYLATTVINTPLEQPLPQPVSVILPEVQRLILDASPGVRAQLLRLLEALPVDEIRRHVDQLVLYTRTAMTHLSSEIRHFALDVLNWLLNVAGYDLVSCPGGWLKTLKCFLTLLSWQAGSQLEWTTSKATFGKPADSKILVKQMNTFSLFLRTGLAPSLSVPVVPASEFPLSHGQHHRLASRTSAYVRLNLFGASRDDEAEMYEDREDRQKVFHQNAEKAVMAGLEDAKRGGGEIGRAAASLRKVLVEGMGDWRADDIRSLNQGRDL